LLFGQEHVRRYKETDGGQGYEWQGTKVLLLTTMGRKSGEPRETPLIFDEHNGAYVIVASKGGAPEHPAWYLNLSDDPEVTVQVKGERFAARARTVGPDERPELWKLLNQSWPAYDEYQQKTDREIPVVALERV
jgi:deazaflavin-dependent oxidoreductase (nitroreductase family)